MPQMRCPNCGGPHPRWECRTVVPASIIKPLPAAPRPQASAPPAETGNPPPPSFAQRARMRAGKDYRQAMVGSAATVVAQVLAAYAAPGVCPHCDHRRQQTAERVRRHRERASQHPG
jgi:hypothetical protein